MKKFVCFALAMGMASSAFATHAYRTMDCQSNDIRLNYKGNYPVGGLYAISRSGSDELLALPNDSETYGEDELKSADVVFEIMASTNIGDVKTFPVCGFDHTEKLTSNMIKLNKVSPEAARKIGVQQGDSLKFVCVEILDTPNGKDCK